VKAVSFEMQKEQFMSLRTPMAPRLAPAIGSTAAREKLGAGQLGIVTGSSTASKPVEARDESFGSWPPLPI
jgi:hypothetical protein